MGEEFLFIILEGGGALAKRSNDLIVREYNEIL